MYESFALRITENKDLEDVGLNMLTHIGNGNVHIEKNSKLCFIETVNWQVIMPNSNVSRNNIEVRYLIPSLKILLSYTSTFRVQGLTAQNVYTRSIVGTSENPKKFVTHVITASAPIIKLVVMRNVWVAAMMKQRDAWLVEISPRHRVHVWKNVPKRLLT